MIKSFVFIMLRAAIFGMLLPWLLLVLLHWALVLGLLLLCGAAVLGLLHRASLLVKLFLMTFCLDLRVDPDRLELDFVAADLAVVAQLLKVGSTMCDCMLFNL